MECQLLYLLDFDLRIDEAELIHHFSPFFKKSTLVSLGTTPIASQRAMPYSASCDDVFVAAQARALAAPRRSEVTPLALSSSVPASTSQHLPVTPEQQLGTKRSVSTRIISRNDRTSPGDSSDGSSSCAGLTEDHSSDDSSSPSDDEANVEGEIRPRYLAQRSFSAMSMPSKAISSYISSSSNEGISLKSKLIKSVSHYDSRSPLAGKGGRAPTSTWV